MVGINSKTTQIEKILVFLLFQAILSGCANSEPSHSSAAEIDENDSIPVSYIKNDLQKIKWIEGKWKGMAGENPFYEIYELINYSTLQITGYEWNGKDSSKSSKSYVYWKNGAYYLGDEMNWKVVEISDRHIKMLPQYKANNDILWKFRDSTGWDAVLVGKKVTYEYRMQHFDPF